MFDGIQFHLELGVTTTTSSERLSIRERWSAAVWPAIPPPRTTTRAMSDLHLRCCTKHTIYPLGYEPRTRVDGSCRLGPSQALPYERRQTRDVPDHRQPLDRVLGDAERRAEHVGLATEEVRRAQYTPLLTLVPFGQHGGTIGFVGHDHAEVVGQVLEGLRFRDVPALLEQRVSQRKAHPLPNLKVGPVGAVGQCQRSKGRGREAGHIEVTEQGGGDLVSYTHLRAH